MAKRTIALVWIAALTTATVLPSCTTETQTVSEREHTSQVASATTLQNAHTIEGYADRLSYVAGDTVNFAVHVPDDSGAGGFTYRVLRYGATAVDGSIVPTCVLNCGSPQTVYVASRQSYPDDVAVVGLGTPGAVGAWPLSAQFVAGSWSTPASGIHAVELTDHATGQVSYIAFVLKDAGTLRKTRMLVASTNTWQAYNFWPYDAEATYESIYKNCNNVGPLANPSQLTNTVAFLRPNPNAAPNPVADQYCTATSSSAFLSYFNRNEHLAVGDIRVAQWLEKSPSTSAYSVMTDWDLHSAWVPNSSIPAGGALDLSILDPSLSPTLIISTHSEYWTYPMKRAAEAYLRLGGNIVSLSGNTMYHTTSISGSPTNSPWQMTKTGCAVGQDICGFWGADEQAAVFGLVVGADYITGLCVPFTVNKSAHWALGSTGLANGSTFGISGVEAMLAAAPNVAGARSVCYDSAGNFTVAGGAVGAETDKAPPLAAACSCGVDTARTCPTTPSSASPASFMRTYDRIATSSNTGLPSDIIFAQKPSAGMIFSAGSIAFGQSLLWDAMQATTPMSQTVTNVMSRFGSRSFSDFDGDGLSDVVTRNGGNLYMGRGAGNGLFVPGLVLIDSGGWDAFDAILSVGDFNSDGHPDLIVREAASGDLYIYHGNGSGGLLAGAVLVGHGWLGLNIVAPGDFDGDGNPDLIAWTDTGGGVRLYKSDGHDGWLNAGYPTSIFIDSRTFDMLIPAGDYNGDGTADLLARTSAGDLFLCRGEGDGTFAAEGCGARINGGWQGFTDIIPVGDFKGFGQTLDGLPKPALLGKDTSGQLNLYTGDSNGCVQASYGAVDSGWTNYSPIVGVW